MKLSILIPTLNEPESIKYLVRLRGILDPQVAKYPGECEIRIHDAGRSMPTGTKRNELIHNSEGEYFSMIDCDDIVPEYYVDELMKAIEYSPDVISFIGEMYTDGRDRRGFTIKLGSKYDEVNGHYYRFCNHLCCYKRSTVERVKFPPVWIQEDYKWACDIQKYLKTEVHINKHMYSYMFDSKKQQNQYARRR